MNNVSRALIFALACSGLVGGFVALRLTRSTSAPAVARLALPLAASGHAAPSLPEVQRAPHLAYRSARPGEFGLVVVAALDDPEKTRAVTQLSCERAHFDRHGGLCLTYDRDALEPNFRAVLVDAAFSPYKTSPTAGYPSRSSLSRDGAYAASTVFTNGDSYDSEFSTRTVIIDRRSGEALPDLEQFTVTKDENAFRRTDFNFWGVTFSSDPNVFFATLGTEGATYLVQGNATARTLRVVRANVECPSLSPNGKIIAFKRRNAETNASQLYTLDIERWQESAIPGESRHIDDQATWLDDSHILYGVTTTGPPERALNIWVADIAPGGAPPRVFIRGASSPSVVH